MKWPTKWLKGKNVSSLEFGLYLKPNQLTVAIPINLKLENPADFKLRREAVSELSPLSKVVLDLKEQFNLNKYLCNIVIDESQYQLILIDRPLVDAKEFRAAAYWACKDMLQYPLEDTVIDVFLPSTKIDIHHDKLYVVASKRSYLMQITDTLLANDIGVKNILTEEFALRNIVTQFIAPQCIAVLIANEGSFFLIVFEEGDILFFRRIKNNLPKELFRSLDFFNVTLKQVRISKLYVLNVETQDLEDISLFFNERQYILSFLQLNQALLRFRSGDVGFQLDQLYAIGGMLQQLTQGAEDNAID